MSLWSGSTPPVVLTLALASALYLALAIAKYLARALPRLVESLKPVPRLSITLDDAEANDVIDAPLYSPPAKLLTKGGEKIPCYDPSTMQSLGTVPAASAADVAKAIAECRVASREWAKSTFARRRALMRVLLKYTVDNQETICRVCARDSGKARVDAAFGEVMTTCEKLWWLIDHGEEALRPEKRPAGRMMFYKSARVEYHPLGVVGAIVPWNYPYHNVLNPLSAALFAGNGLVLKVSEHAAWSGVGFVKRIVDAALESVGAPKGLVQIIAGYGDAGAALVSGGVDHLIFVGSTGVGRAVAAGAAPTLTPVTLELGGKDAFVVCDDADLDAALAAGLRGAFQSCGQNCAGAERFIVHKKVAREFAERAGAAARAMRQGPPLGAVGSGEQAVVDSGSMCMPTAVAAVAALVDDAVAKGAELLAGGKKVDSKDEKGQFYPPTVLFGVKRGMRLWEEEVFGPVFAVAVADSDDDAVALANDCPFGLGSAVFSKNQRRARAIGQRLEAGMTSINDFATTYMCQSLPFGGVKESGYGRFAGVEGLRALTTPKAVAEDAAPSLVRTQIPPLLRYPIPKAGFGFVCGLIRMFYAPDWLGVFKGLGEVIVAAVAGGGGGVSASATPSASTSAPATASTASRKKK